MIFDTNDPAGLTAKLEQGQDLFSITLLPIVSIDEGLRPFHEVTQEPLLVF